MKHITGVALAVTLSVGTAGADTMGFTDFIGFGDSLSDKGRFPEGLATSPPQDGSRFSDGPTWMEQVGAAFEARGGENINLALGGATAGPNTVNREAQYNFAEAVQAAENGPRSSIADDPDDIPYLDLINFGAQVNSLLSRGFVSTLDDNPLVTVLLGGNDFLGLPDNPTEPEFQSVGATIITSLANGISTLAAADAKLDDFMISNMPSFTKAPSIFLVPQAFKDPTDMAIQAFNTALADSMELLEAQLTLGLGRQISIEMFDLYTTFETTYQAGLDAGLIGFDSCLPDSTTNNCPNEGDSSAYLFLDDIHPNSFLQTGIADGALAQLASRIAPVPLPAGLPLLLLGMAAFGVMKRRAA